MKNLIIFLITIATYSQEYSKIALIQSPGSYEDGWSIGIQYEHQNNIIYYGGEVYIFPNLNNLDYIHLIGRFGFNQDIFKDIRVYVGGRGGFLWRDWTNKYALLGGEIGIDYFFLDNLFIGLQATSDCKTDSKYWGNEPHHTVNSGIVRFGIIF